MRLAPPTFPFYLEYVLWFLFNKNENILRVYINEDIKSLNNLPNYSLQKSRKFIFYLSELLRLFFNHSGCLNKQNLIMTDE